MNRTKKTYFVMQRVRWELVLDLGVDVSKPIEQRVEGRAARIQVLEVDNERVDPLGPDMLTAITPKEAARMRTVPHVRK